jgi:hypothetical protein
MPWAGLEPMIPASERKTVHALDRAATVSGDVTTAEFIVSNDTEISEHGNGKGFERRNCGLTRCFVVGTWENHENESVCATFWPRPQAGTSPLRSKSAINLIVMTYRYECHANGGDTTSALHNTLSRVQTWMLCEFRFWQRIFSSGHSFKISACDLPSNWESYNYFYSYDLWVFNKSIHQYKPRM